MRQNLLYLKHILDEAVKNISVEFKNKYKDID